MRKVIRWCNRCYLVKQRIKIIGIGGTIVSKATTDGFKPEMGINELISRIPEIVDYCDFDFEQLMNTDSSNLQPEDWEEISQTILSAVNDDSIDGVVVIHGTDTMTFTAAATAMLLRNLSKPVVFTGSQIPFLTFGSDARRNIIDSVRVIAETNIAETIIVFNSRIYRGCRTVKLREYDLSAFETVDKVPIGEISRKIDITDPFVKVSTSKKVKAWYDGPLNPRVALVRMFPGMDPDLLLHLADMGYQGLVIEGYGSGNLPLERRGLLNTMEELQKRGIAVVITTQCVYGKTENLYETGKKFFRVGAISGFDMISETALIKLMWALGKTRDLNKVGALMHTNLAGEIHTLSEE